MPLDKEFYAKWNERDKDRKDISECVQCSKSYHDPIFNNTERNPRRQELRVCRECFYDINKNQTPEIELLFKLVDKKVELASVASEVGEVFDKMIEDRRTAKRVELDEFQKKAGFVFYGEHPRPEGFVGDPAGEPRLEVLFGFDPVSGGMILPTITMNDGEIG